MSQKLKWIIGGSASTGSSLLAHMLGQHSKIYCGIETNLFIQSEWILHWDRLKKDINRASLDRVLSTGWHIHRGVQINGLLKGRNIDAIISKSVDYKQFIYKIYSYICDDSTNHFIAEKTPSNAPNFHLLRSRFDDLKFVLTLRNPIDSIISMQKRGWSLIYSCGLYLFNIGLGYGAEKDIHVVKYEELIKDTPHTLSSVLKTVDLEYENDMASNFDGMEVLPSWRYGRTQSEKDTVLLTSINQDTIDYLFDHLCFKDDFQFYGRKPAFKNIREIAEHFSYTIHPSSNSWKEGVRIKSLLLLEKMKRSLRHYPCSGKNFPFVIR